MAACNVNTEIFEEDRWIIKFNFQLCGGVKFTYCVYDAQLTNESDWIGFIDALKSGKYSKPYRLGGDSPSSSSEDSPQSQNGFWALYVTQDSRISCGDGKLLFLSMQHDNDESDIDNEFEIPIPHRFASKLEKAIGYAKKSGCRFLDSL